jgi:hypothetical protein
MALSDKKLDSDWQRLATILLFSKYPVLYLCIPRPVVPKHHALGLPPVCTVLQRVLLRATTLAWGSISK